MFQHTVQSDSVTIAVPQAFAWQVLLDFERYEQWNPFTFKVKTDLVIGQLVELHVHLPKRGKSVQKEYLKHLQASEQIAWGMHILAPQLLKARRTQYLNKLNHNQCQYRTDDALEGLLTPLVKALYGESMRQGFNQMAHALKLRAETLWQQQQEEQHESGTAYSTP